MNSENKVLYIVGWFMLGILILVVAVGQKSSVSLTSIGAPCIFHSYFGLYCPGCGGTRSVLSLVKGQIVQSFIFHPVIPYMLAIYAGYMISNSIQLITRGRFKIGMKYKDAYLWIALGIILINFIVKNMVYIGWGIRIIE